MAIIRQQIPMTKHETLLKGKGLQNLTSSKHFICTCKGIISSIL